MYKYDYYVFKNKNASIDNSQANRSKYVFTAFELDSAEMENETLSGKVGSTLLSSSIGERALKLQGYVFQDDGSANIYSKFINKSLLAAVFTPFYPVTIEYHQVDPEDNDVIVWSAEAVIEGSVKWGHKANTYVHDSFEVHLILLNPYLKLPIIRSTDSTLAYIEPYSLEEVSIAESTVDGNNPVLEFNNVSDNNYTLFDKVLLYASEEVEFTFNEIQFTVANDEVEYKWSVKIGWTEEIAADPTTPGLVFDPRSGELVINGTHYETYTTSGSQTLYIPAGPSTFTMKFFDQEVEKDASKTIIVAEGSIDLLEV